MLRDNYKEVSTHDLCSTTETAESGVEELDKSVDIGLSLPKCSQPSTSQPMEFTSRAAEKKKTLSSSFVDPFR